MGVARRASRERRLLFANDRVACDRYGYYEGDHLKEDQERQESGAHLVVRVQAGDVRATFLQAYLLGRL